MCESRSFCMESPNRWRVGSVCPHMSPGAVRRCAVAPTEGLCDQPIWLLVAKSAERGPIVVSLPHGALVRTASRFGEDGQEPLRSTVATHCVLLDDSRNSNTQHTTGHAFKFPLDRRAIESPEPTAKLQGLPALVTCEGRPSRRVSTGSSSMAP